MSIMTASLPSHLSSVQHVVLLKSPMPLSQNQRPHFKMKSLQSVILKRVWPNATTMIRNTSLDTHRLSVPSDDDFFFKISYFQKIKCETGIIRSQNYEYAQWICLCYFRKIHSILLLEANLWVQLAEIRIRLVSEIIFVEYQYEKVKTFEPVLIFAV